MIAIVDVDLKDYGLNRDCETLALVEVHGLEIDYQLIEKMMDWFEKGH